MHLRTMLRAHRRINTRCPPCLTVGRHFHTTQSSTLRSSTTGNDAQFDPFVNRKSKASEAREGQDTPDTNPDNFVRPSLVGKSQRRSSGVAPQEGSTSEKVQKISHALSADLPVFRFHRTFQTMRSRMLSRGGNAQTTITPISAAEEGPYLISQYTKAGSNIKIGAMLGYAFVLGIVLLLMMAWNIGPESLNNSVVMDPGAIVPVTCLLLATMVLLLSVISLLSRRTIFKIDVQETLTAPQLLGREPLKFRFFFQSMNPASLRPRQYTIGQEDIVRASFMEDSSRKHPQIGVTVRTQRPGLQRLWRNGPIYHILKLLWPIEREYRRAFFVHTPSREEAEQVLALLQPFTPPPPSNSGTTAAATATVKGTSKPSIEKSE